MGLDPVPTVPLHSGAKGRVLDEPDHPFGKGVGLFGGHHNDVDLSRFDSTSSFFQRIARLRHHPSRKISLAAEE